MAVEASGALAMESRGRNLKSWLMGYAVRRLQGWRGGPDRLELSGKMASIGGSTQWQRAVERWRWRSIGGAIQNAGCISKELSLSRRQDASQLNRQDSAKGKFTHGVPIELVAEAKRWSRGRARESLNKSCCSGGGEDGGLGGLAIRPIGRGTTHRSSRGTGQG
ncbi:unnamed protein product [Calypogeia fissa]